MGYALIDSPMGPLGLTWNGGMLAGIDLDPASTPGRLSEPAPRALVTALRRYFRDSRSALDLPVTVVGSAFQCRVWACMRAIPPGETRTYGDIARELGSAPRAVGQACRANPVPIVVPCHRVVAATGLGGFAGDTSGRRLDAKRWLLRHEGARVDT